MPRRSRRGLGRQERRKKVWCDQVISFSAITAIQAIDLTAAYRGIAGSSTVGMTTLGCNVQQNCTVNAGTGTAATAVHVGIYVDSFNAAVAELSNPIVDPFEDWAWNTRYYVDPVATAGFQYDDSSAFRCKVGRKVEELQQTLWYVIVPVLGGATNLNYEAHVRTIIALP